MSGGGLGEIPIQGIDNNLRMKYSLPSVSVHRRCAAMIQDSMPLVKSQEVEVITQENYPSDSPLSRSYRTIPVYGAPKNVEGIFNKRDRLLPSQGKN